MTDDDVKRFYWLESQRLWHELEWPRNFEKRGWHRSQARWYNRQINKLPGILPFMVGKILRERTQQVCDNVSKNNALFSRLRHSKEPFDTFFEKE